MKYKKICYVVLVYNELEYTIKTFESLKQQKQDLVCFDIVCVDNASADEYAGPLKQYCQDNNIRYLYHEINDGYAGGNNYAYSIVKSEGYEMVFIANNDIELLHHDITENIVRCFETNDKIALVGANCEDSNGNKIEISGLSSLIAKLDRVTTLDNENFRSTPFVIGCFFAIRTDVLDNLFDSSFFMYSEEQKLDFQLMNLGYYVGCLKNQDYVVKHYGGFFDWSKQSDWSIYLSTRNFVLTSKCFKHFYTKLSFYVIYFGILLKNALIHRKFGIFRGYFSGLYMIIAQKKADYIYDDAIRCIKHWGGKNRN